MALMTNDNNVNIPVYPEEAIDIYLLGERFRMCPMSSNRSIKSIFSVDDRTVVSETVHRKQGFNLWD